MALPDCYFLGLSSAPSLLFERIPSFRRAAAIRFWAALSFLSLYLFDLGVADGPSGRHQAFAGYWPTESCACFFWGATQRFARLR
jgi:hypothetical protein